ncbi:MAG: HXXEE domain-containing protein [Saprospiraceae bacterium]|nr:HXXEE domain-containing protein [Candidatus Opimibacter skivensis]
MKFLRNNWFDLGAVLAVIVLVYVFFSHHVMTDYQILMWLSLVSLFMHQMEEYRIVGTFPGMINSLMFKSKMPDRYPLNTNSAFYVNVVVGWTSYFLAAVLAEKAIWLGIATMVVSVGNVMAHTFLFNIKGKTLYNPGMATSWLFFAPGAYFFISIVYTQHLATNTDYVIGIGLGLVMNIVGVFKLIQWLADEHTSYIFSERHMLPQGRRKGNA